jgi:uncharacterized membrane protein
MIKYILSNINPLDKNRYFSIKMTTQVFAYGVAAWLIIDLLYRFFVSRPDYVFFHADYNEILSNLIGTLTTIVVSSFTLIIVALQIASQQFSPRILRMFFAVDLRVQGFLGFYIGSILYCYVIKSLGAAENDYLNPAVVIGLVLGVLCLLAFPLFVTYYVDNINAASITERIKHRTMDEVNTLYPVRWMPGSEKTSFKRVCTNPSAVRVHVRSPFNSGYLDEVNYALLLPLKEALVKKYPELQISGLYQKPIIGEFIGFDTSRLLAAEMPARPSPEMEAQLEKDLLDIVQQTYIVTKYRSYDQDINFGIRQLVDIGIKAISPAVNDPTTCVNCIDYLGDIVRQLADREFPSVAASKMTSAEIHVNEFDFDELLDFSFGQIYQWGQNDPIIVKRLINTISNIIPVVENPLHLAILIKEVEDFDFDFVKLHETQLSKKEKARFQRESRESIHRELNRFHQNTAEQVQKLEQKGILQMYEMQPDETGPLERDRKPVIDAVVFLRKFL